VDKRQIHNFAGWDQRVWDIRLLGCFYAFVDSDLWVWCQMKIFQEPDTLAIWTLRGLAQISRGAVASGSCSDCFCCNMLQPWSAVVQIHLLQYSSNFCWWDFVPAPYRFPTLSHGIPPWFPFFHAGLFVALEVADQVKPARRQGLLGHLRWRLRIRDGHGAIWIANLGKYPLVM